MAQSALSPEEYELHLKDLKQRLTDFVERGQGDPEQLRREAEQALSLADTFPDVYERYPEIEGMVGDLLARERQAEVFGTGQEREPRGCLLGWLFRRRGSESSLP
jgi:hypothetical protein